MNVLMLNGSPHSKGCTYTALKEIGETLNSYGIDYEIFQIGAKPVQDCIACGKCNEEGCIFTDDKVNEFIKIAKKADGFVFGSPVYYAHPSGRILSFLDRAFFANSGRDWERKAFQFKPAAAIVSARRGGTTASFDVLNKYFTISNMPVVGSSYWNMVHGNTPEEVMQDKEGLQTMRNIAHNMAWLLKCIEIGKQNNIAVPQIERSFITNFIR